MTAVVVAPPAPRGISLHGVPLSIFPGSATPSVFSADVPFWIGSAFVPEPGDPVEEAWDALHERTRFELDVDGAYVSLATDLEIADGRTVQKLSIGIFAVGLPAGWHRFAGRWYVEGKLVLSTERSIEFVER